MDAHTLTTNGDVTPVVPVSPADETLDALLAQNTEQFENLRAWRWVTVGSMALALVCASLAYVGWWMRPEVVPMVQHVFVDAQGTPASVGPPVPLAQYTPQDWQWISLVREYVLRLRLRGYDERQVHLAWEWLEWHTCGQAVPLLKQYFDLEDPFRRIGQKTRDVLDVNVTKGDTPLAYTVHWNEVYTQHPQPSVKTEQTVTFWVARREVKKDGLQINPWGMCIRVWGGIKL